MPNRFSVSVFALFCVAPLCFPQQRVSLRNPHERLLCVAPLAGSGTWDPKRPLYGPPLPKPAEAPSRDCIIAYDSIQSDDGGFALVKCVARVRSAFAQIYAERRPDVRVCRKGVVKRNDIERELRRFTSEAKRWSGTGSLPL